MQKFLSQLQMGTIRIYNESKLYFHCIEFFRRSVVIVCVCHRVSDREIARYAQAGLGFDDIQLELGVATQCGRCESCARDIVAQCCASRPVAAVRQVTRVSESQAWTS